MKRERDEERFKKKERNPLIVLVFSCVVLFYHTLPPSNVCACVCVCMFVYVCVHQSPTITQQSFPLSQLYHCLCLRPSFPCHLPFSQSCHTALLPYLVIPLKIFHCNTPTHASRNGKVTSLTRNMKLCAAAVTPNLFPYPLVCHIKNTQPGYKRAKSTNCSVWHLLPHKAKK